LRLRSTHAPLLYLIAGLLAAAAAAWLTWSAQESVRRTVDVVVATKDVAPLAAIMPGDVAVRPEPIQAVPADALRASDAVIGRYVRFGLLSGQVVRAANLATTAVGAGPMDARMTTSVGDDPAVRAVAVALQATTGLDLPAPGDHVDLLAVVRGQGSTQARVLATRVLVLDRMAVGQGASGPAGSGSNPPMAQQGALVLALTVPQAQEVALAQTISWDIPWPWSCSKTTSNSSRSSNARWTASRTT
jgi:Flp pilus assembly protein CpaB